MSTRLNGQAILDQFHIYTGDQSELATADELTLLNKKYDEVLGLRPWEILKQTATGTILNSGGVYYITLPDDFRYFIENNEKTDNSSTTYNNASQKVIFVGTNYTPYQIVNFSDRRQFRNSSGYAYLDMANSRIVFTGTPSDTTYEFDYIGNWDAIEAATYPIFPADFHIMLAQLMAVDSVIIELFDRAHSYAKENQKGADEAISRMYYWNSQFTLN